MLTLGFVKVTYGYVKKAEPTKDPAFLIIKKPKQLNNQLGLRTGQALGSVSDLGYMIVTPSGGGIGSTTINIKKAFAESASVLDQ